MRVSKITWSYFWHVIIVREDSLIWGLNRRWMEETLWHVIDHLFQVIKSLMAYSLVVCAQLRPLDKSAPLGSLNQGVSY